MGAIRMLDVILVVVTAPVVVLIGAPTIGILAGAVAWVAQRMAARMIEAGAKRSGDFRRALVMNLAGSFVRAWIVGVVILFLGFYRGRDDGLAAAILILVAFTIYFATTLLLRTVDRSSAAS